RIGSRPFNAAEMARLYQRKDGSVWTVTDTPGTSYSHVGTPAGPPRAAVDAATQAKGVRP
ncbi:MAG: hypothetical protein KA164_08120, partial [Rhodoferax sp.]|nr:hypothetical protein [Rhodoferax sp.]